MEGKTVLKVYDFFCPKCSAEVKDVYIKENELIECGECGIIMHKDYSGFKGMHTDSNFRPSAVRRKGKYKYKKVDRTERKENKKQGRSYK